MASEQNDLNTKRLELHSKLVTLLGSNNVYFQPSESVKITYPAIIYERYDIPIINADNLNYLIRCKYKVTVVDNIANNAIVDRMSKFPTAKFNRHYIADHLSHDVFMIYY